MKDHDRQKASASTVVSLAQLLEQQPPTPPPSLVEPGLLPAQGIWFVGGEPKVGKSLLVAKKAVTTDATLAHDANIVMGKIFCVLPYILDSC